MIIYLISPCWFSDASYMNDISRQYSGTIDNSKCHINEEVRINTYKEGISIKCGLLCNLQMVVSQNVTVKAIATLSTIVLTTNIALNGIDETAHAC